MSAETPAPPGPDDGGARSRQRRRGSAPTHVLALLGLVREQVFAITLGAGI